MVAIRFTTANSIDATNVRYLFDFAVDEVQGTPIYSPTRVTVSLPQHDVTFHGDFTAFVQAVQKGDLDALLAAVPLTRVDAIVTSAPFQTIEVTQLNLAGEGIATFLADEDAGYAFALRLNDTIVADAGNDTLSGFAGNDIVLGMAGNDLITGDAGDDEINGNMGLDTVLGGQGRDFVRGGQDNDQVFGESDDDWHVNGNNGADTVHGNDGDDVVHGGQNGDLLFGDAGADTLSGDLGDDTMDGGGGADRFRFGTESGFDVIKAFLADLDGDRILVSANPNGLLLTPAGLVAGSVQVTEGTLVNFGGNNVVLLENFSRPSLREEFFIVL